jgi:hypothetical protein
MKQDPIQEAMFICYSNLTQESAAYNNIETRVYNTLCDGTILQKRLVKEPNSSRHLN